MEDTASKNIIDGLLSRRITPGTPDAFTCSGEQVMIYGAGSCGRDVLGVLAGHGVAARGFLDMKVASGTRINNLVVLHPDDNSITVEERARTCVVVGIFNAFTDIPAVMEALKGFGYETVVSFLELHRYFHDELGDRFWLTTTDLYESNKSSLYEGFSVWDDEKSRELYKSVLEFRFTGDYGALPAPEPGKQYFDSAMPRWKEPVSFIDCGSFDGDTLKDLRDAYGTVDMVAAYEPDPDNFSKVAGMVESADPPVAKSAALFPCGVWSRQAQFSFASGADGGSHLSNSGDIQVQCVSLDESLHGFRPTLIKMDVEGAEYEALIGARRIIAEDRPDLAICVYHRPEDLWRIPLMVRAWGLGYKFHLRMYNFSGFDLVMYAVKG